MHEVTEEWHDKYPNSMKRWKENWDVISPMFKFSADVRKIMYTTSAIESLNSALRRLNSQRIVFPSDTVLLNALYLAIYETSTVIFGKGRICTVKEAISRIEMSGFKDEKIQDLKDLVYEANQARSVQKAVNIFKQVLEKSEIKRLFYIMDLIDTDCITVTTADSKLFRGRYITLPSELLKSVQNGRYREKLLTNTLIKISVRKK